MTIPDLASVNEKLDAIGQWCLVHHEQSEVVVNRLAEISIQQQEILDKLEYIEEAVSSLLDAEEADRRMRWVLGRRWAWLEYRRSPEAAALVWWYVQYKIHGANEEEYEPVPRALLENPKRRGENPPQVVARPAALRRRRNAWEVSG